jgi:hypothetical protein
MSKGKSIGKNNKKDEALPTAAQNEEADFIEKRLNESSFRP